MRLWTLHPTHLDSAGLVALWREALLAQAVLHGRTRGYVHHPQLRRFRDAADPLAAISSYLHAIHAEARQRGYQFNAALILGQPTRVRLTETEGQLAYEWAHLEAKLKRRDHAWWEAHHERVAATAHPLFRIVAGSVREWERMRSGPGRAETLLGGAAAPGSD